MSDGDFVLSAIPPPVQCATLRLHVQRAGRFRRVSFKLDILSKYEFRKHKLPKCNDFRVNCLTDHKSPDSDLEANSTGISKLLVVRPHRQKFVDVLLNVSSSVSVVCHACGG